MIKGLKLCPCCGSLPETNVLVGDLKGVMIACKRNSCKLVRAANFRDAKLLWNEKRFHDINDK